MSIVAEPSATVADLLEQLGRIDASRIRLHPAPGEAGVQDVLRIHARERRLFELVDGVLVEKIMGFRESILAAALIRFLGAFVKAKDLGLVGMVRLAAGLVRIPYVSFVSWARLPGRAAPVDPVPFLAPDLAVEILSEGNTPGEMLRKVGEFFAAGVRL